jgi:DNA-directed RNA polymerase specialized sigma24 family protein
MTAEGLARLLARLDPDAERAALAYERLRRALLKFFDWRGVWPPEECADQTIDRLIRKLEEQTVVSDVQNYAYGIARLVLLERRRQPMLASIDEASHLVSVAASPADEGDERDERLHGCLERCLAAMPEEHRSLVLGYYEGERHAKISNRRHLAATLGLSENALRSRVQRLRDRLERCVLGCISTPK